MSPWNRIDPSRLLFYMLRTLTNQFLSSYPLGLYSGIENSKNPPYNIYEAILKSSIRAAISNIIVTTALRINFIRYLCKEALLSSAKLLLRSLARLLPARPRIFFPLALCTDILLATLDLEQNRQIVKTIAGMFADFLSTGTLYRHTAGNTRP